MARKATLELTILGDSSQAQREINKFVSGLKGVDSKVSTSTSGLDKFAAGAGRFADKTKLASLGAGAALLYTAKAASDLNETVSFTGVTFKSSADEMEAWAATALAKLGLAKQSALDAANGFGGLFQTTGSTAEEAANLSQQLVQLAVDMSSAKNVGLEETMDALKSGLIGEAEPMRRFNVLLSEAEIKSYAVKNGIAGANEELSEAQKVQARLGVIMEQTTDIQGDYARTSDSAANQQRRAVEAAKDASAELGQNLAPILAKIADLGADVAQVFGSMPSELQNVTLGVGGLVFAASPLAKTFELGALGVKKYRDLLNGLAIMQALGSTTAGRFAAALNLTPWAITIAGAYGLKVAIEETGEALGGLIARTHSLPGLLGGRDGTDPEAHAVIEQNKQALHDLAEELAGVGAPGDEVWHSLEAVHLKLKELGVDWLTASPTEFQHALAQVRTELARVSDAHKTHQQFVRDTGFEYERFAGMTLGEFNEWRGGTVENFNRVEGALDRLADKHRVTAADILKAFSKQLQAQREFGRNWSIVARRAEGDADSLLQTIQEDYGAQAPQIVAALAAANKQQFAAIVRTWNLSEKEARELSRILGQSFGQAKGSIQGARGEADEFYQSLLALRRVARLEVEARIHVPSSTSSFTPPAGPGPRSSRTRTSGGTSVVQGGDGAAVHIHFHRDVYGFDDFRDKVELAIRELKRRP